MAYVTKAQLGEECKLRLLADSTYFSTTTTPSLAKADEIIAEEEAKINAQIGRKYTLPLVGANSLLILRGISLALCAERVRNIIEVAGMGTEKEQKATGISAGDRARKTLNEIEDGTFPLTEEVLLSSTDGIRSYAVDNGNRPIFKKGIDQW